MGIPEVGSLYLGGTVEQRRRLSDGTVALRVGDRWLQILQFDNFETLTTEHVGLLASNSDFPARQAAIALWAKTPHKVRELVVNQCNAEVVTQLKQTVFYS